jgi:hypothetical protein
LWSLRRLRSLRWRLLGLRWCRRGCRRRRRWRWRRGALLFLWWCGHAWRALGDGLH